jgi:fibronectin type 3 domain-containing protein
MKTKLFLLLVLVSTVSLGAKQPVSRVVAFPSANRILLRWERENDNQTFAVYRKASNENGYRRLNDKPLRMLTGRKEILDLLGDDYPGFKQTFRLDYPEQLVTLFEYQPGYMRFAAAYTPKLAVLLGEGFIDTTVVPGESYDYRIEVTEGQQVQMLADAFRVTAESRKPGPPANVRVIAGVGYNELFWDTDDRSAAGYHVYRSVNGKAGAYIRLNPRKLIFSQGKEVSGDFPEYVDTPVDAKQDCWYKVTGVSLFDEEGMFSEAVHP